MLLTGFPRLCGDGMTVTVYGLPLMFFPLTLFRSQCVWVEVGSDLVDLLEQRCFHLQYLRLCSCFQAAVHVLQAAGELGVQELHLVSLCCQGFDLVPSELVQLADELCSPLLKDLVQLINFAVDFFLDSCFLVLYLP